MSTPVVLILIVAFVSGLAITMFVKPIRNIIIQASANRRAGLWSDPEFQRQMRRLDAVRWLTIAAQIILLGAVLVLVARPSMIGWIIVVILFAISYVVRARNEAARLRLLTQGLKKES